jgi:hypothetical protein
MKDKELPNAFTLDEGDKELSLDEIIAADENDAAAEDKVINGERRKKKVKKAILIGGTSALAVAVTAGFLFLSPFSGGLNFNNSDSNTVATASADPSATDPAPNPTISEPPADTTEDFAKDPSKMYPIPLKDWQTKLYKSQDGDTLKKDIVASLSGSEINSSSNVLPSESSGFTADDSKQSLDDGSLNTFYSYWTAEQFQSEVGGYLERLLNPTFGGWEMYQHNGIGSSGYFDTTLISDMFTDKWVTDNANKTTSEYVPVFADWGANNYGLSDTLLSMGSRWIGTVSSSDTIFTYDQEKLQYSADITAQIKFTAWTKDQTKLEKNGTLTLHLVANADHLNSTNHKVLIDSANLKMEG